MSYLVDSPLGKKSDYVTSYQPDLLFAIPRSQQRENIGIHASLPFHGADIWNAYELSWLNLKGKPVVAMAQVELPCFSPNIIESKSFKLI
jgi:7-cyano-7-deazaguanine reductase